MKIKFTPDQDSLQAEFQRVSGGHSGVPLALISFHHESFGTVEKWVSSNDTFDGPESWDEVQKIGEELVAKQADEYKVDEFSEDFAERLRLKGGKLEADGGLYTLITD